MEQKFIDLTNYIEQEQTEAEKIISEYYDINSQIKTLEKRKKELSNQLKDNTPGNYKLGNYVAEVVEMPGRVTLDKKEVDYFLESHGKSIKEFEKQGNSFRKLSVKRLN